MTEAVFSANCGGMGSGFYIWSISAVPRISAAEDLSFVRLNNLGLPGDFQFSGVDGLRLSVKSPTLSPRLSKASRPRSNAESHQLPSFAFVSGHSSLSAALLAVAI